MSMLTISKPDAMRASVAGGKAVSLRHAAEVLFHAGGRRVLPSPVQVAVRGAVERAGLWEALKTDWVCLDCELMPWSAKAQELLRLQYASTGAAARQ